MSYYAMNGLAGALGDLFFDPDAKKAFWRVQQLKAGEKGLLSEISQEVYGNAYADTWGKIVSYNQGRKGVYPAPPPAGPGEYKVGTVLELPTIPNRNAPYSGAKNSSLKVMPEGEFVLPDGSTVTIGPGGDIIRGDGGSQKAGMSTGLLLGIGALVVGGVALLAVTAKKKPM